MKTTSQTMNSLPLLRYRRGFMSPQAHQLPSLITGVVMVVLLLYLVMHSFKRYHPLTWHSSLTRQILKVEQSIILHLVSTSLTAEGSALSNIVTSLSLLISGSPPSFSQGTRFTMRTGPSLRRHSSLAYGKATLTISCQIFSAGMGGIMMSKTVAVKFALCLQSSSPNPTLNLKRLRDIATR